MNVFYLFMQPIIILSNEPKTLNPVSYWHRHFYQSKVILHYIINVISHCLQHTNQPSNETTGVGVKKQQLKWAQINHYEFVYIYSCSNSLVLIQRLGGEDFFFSPKFQQTAIKLCHAMKA